MSHNTWDYAGYLRDRGYRMTPQRQIIMDAICEAQGHTTLAEILRRVQAKAPAVNQATVYRTLHFLHETGLVVKAEINPGEIVYELAGQSPHHHLLCRHCHHEIEIDAESLAVLQQAIQARHGFAIDANHLVLTGLCAYCQHELGG
ncbi:MAG TPA: Fur family transcriptional regulator [Caldilineaceae bacterium]|nr:Fur family transcriptional regulator [Caldilineaceae bacterium]